MTSGKSGNSLERGTAVPMYRQVADVLRSRIVSGDYAADMLLPTERELMSSYDISRVTVRLAMDLLENQGLIVRHRGKGTFVAPRRVRHDLSVLSGFYDTLSAQGVEPTTTLEAYRIVEGRDAEVLGLPYERVVYVERTYVVEQEPIAIVRAVLHPRAATIGRELAALHPNYAILTTLLNFVVDRADVAIRAKLPDAAIAAGLGIGPAEPVLVLDRTSYALGDVAIEKSQFFIRSDRYEFALALRGGHTVAQSIRETGAHEPLRPSRSRRAPHTRTSPKTRKS
jgi:GntR family transcriptional regulator